VGRKKGNWKLTFVAKGPNRLGEGRVGCEGLGGKRELEWGVTGGGDVGFVGEG
jgi:hypothetical protein